MLLFSGFCEVVPKRMFAVDHGLSEIAWFFLMFHLSEVNNLNS